MYELKKLLKKAVGYMVISAIAFTFLNVFVKQNSQFNVYQIVFFRSVGSLFFTVPFLLKNKISFIGNKQKLLVYRALAGLTSMILFFKSMTLLPAGTAVSLRYVAPIFAAVFALIWLKEKIKSFQWLFLAVAFLGVLILKGFDTQINSIGMIFALSSAAFTGAVFILLRKIGDADHPVVVVNYFMIIAAIIAGIMMIPYWKTPVGIEWILLLSLGVFGYYGQLYMTKAFQKVETNTIAPLKYLEVIFTLLIGIVWFRENYTIWSLLGITLIIAGLTLNVFVKRR
ncbi:MAG: drug/metabolite transporter (DMT)-like permease [Ulvibacter sp.]|jgi:drug/metabolite transporter (DMT)-like permease